METLPDFISIIIVAQGRKEFVKFAIDTALNQTMDRSMYEIIVVKDFSDPATDRMIDENGIMGITVDPASGEKLSRVAVKRSRGNIVCFLDDDDLYDKNRLEKIRAIFSNQKIGYYHNSVITVDEAGNPTNSLNRIQPVQPFIAGADGRNERVIAEMLRVGASFNISSIAVRKELMYEFMDYYERLPLSLDLFLFYSALMSKYDMYIDSEKLSYYRLHKSVSNSIGTYEEFKAKREWFLKLLVDDYLLITDMVKGSVAEKYALAELSEAKLRLDIFRQDRERKPSISDYARMLGMALPGKWSYHVELIILSLSSRILAERTRRMVYNRYMEEVGNVISEKPDLMVESA